MTHEFDGGHDDAEGSSELVGDHGDKTAFEFTQFAFLVESTLQFQSGFVEFECAFGDTLFEILIEFDGGVLGDGALFEGTIEGSDPGGAEDQDDSGDGAPSQELAMAISG